MCWISSVQTRHVRSVVQLERCLDHLCQFWLYQKWPTKGYRTESMSTAITFRQITTKPCPRMAMHGLMECPVYL